jgi:hypothetical protein
MSLILDGSNGLSDVDGSAATPAIRGTDANTGIFFPAADTIAFSEGGTEAMRIDSSARLLVGNTTSNNLPYLGTQFAAGFQNYATSGTGGFYRYSADTSPSVFTFAKSRSATIGSQTVVNSSDNLGYIGFAGSDGTNFISAAYIIGVVDGVPGTNDMPGRLIFGTTADGASIPTERMRITSAGDLLLNTTSSVARITALSAGTTSATKVIQLSNSASTELLAIVSDGSFYTGTAAASPYNNTTAAGANIHCTSGGQLLRSTSSLKYKTNVQDAEHGLSKVMQLRPVTYKGKNDGNTVFGGLIAEEVHEAGLAEFVQYAEDGSPDALAYGNMVVLAFKAIQELKAELDTVKAELATLKA